MYACMQLCFSLFTTYGSALIDIKIYGVCLRIFSENEENSKYSIAKKVAYHKQFSFSESIIRWFHKQYLQHHTCRNWGCSLVWTLDDDIC